MLSQPAGRSVHKRLHEPGQLPLAAGLWGACQCMSCQACHPHLEALPPPPAADRVVTCVGGKRDSAIAAIMAGKAEVMIVSYNTMRCAALFLPVMCRTTPYGALLYFYRPAPRPAPRPTPRDALQSLVKPLPCPALPLPHCPAPLPCPVVQHHAVRPPWPSRPAPRPASALRPAPALSYNTVVRCDLCPSPAALDAARPAEEPAHGARLRSRTAILGEERRRCSAQPARWRHRWPLVCMPSPLAPAPPPAGSLVWA